MSSPQITAQDIKAFSQKTRPFWKPVLDANRASSEYFSVKICYRAGEFEQPQMAARCFPFELDKNAYFELIDFNFNPLQPGRRRLHRLAFDPTNKQKWPFFPNPNGGQYLIPISAFELVHDEASVVPLAVSAPVAPPVAPVAPEPLYKLTPEAQAQQMQHAPQPAIQPAVSPVPPASTAPVPHVVTDFSHTDARPMPEGPSKLPAPEVTAEADETHYRDDEQPDEHPSKLTARDQYALRHNLPLSNKGWINRMIREGQQLQLEMAREFHQIQSGQ